MTTTRRKPPESLQQAFRVLPKSALDSMMGGAVSAAREKKQSARRELEWSPHGPNSYAQRTFEESEHKELLYGGAAGGGKSDGLLRSSLRFMHVPGYHAIIFRRTFPMLNRPDGLIMRSKEWIGRRAVYNEGKHSWTFPSGATLTFASMQHLKDREDHQGAAYAFIGFDELTQFTKEQYTYLFHRCRRKKGERKLFPLRVRATSNPGGSGHFWVKNRFIRPFRATCAALEITIPRGRSLDAVDLAVLSSQTPANGRLFIPAFRQDNVDLDNEAYGEMLAELTEVERRQLDAGDWDADASGQILTQEMIERCYSSNTLWSNGYRSARGTEELYVGFDCGRTNHRAVIWLWELIRDVLYCREIYVMHKTKFAEQKKQLRKRLNLAGVVKARLDQGGIGYQLAEDLSAEFPGIVEGVALTGGVQGRIATKMKAAFEQARVRIPDGDDDLDEDLSLVQDGGVRRGQPHIETEEGDSGHADRFWAAGLGMDAIPKFAKRQPTAVKKETIARGVTTKKLKPLKVAVPKGIPSKLKKANHVKRRSGVGPRFG